MAKKILRIGVIGSGGIAATHIEKLRKAGRDDWQVAAAADVDAKRVDAFAEKFGIEKRYTDWKKLAADPDVDAITICTPNKLHHGPALAAARAGKHVMVEKPMAMNAKECAEMCDAARKAGTQLQIGFQWRFTAAAQYLAKLARAGRFGKILYVRAQALRRMGIPSWGVFGRKDLQGGGPMIDIGVHILELAHYIMGRPQPTRARGAVHTYIGDKKPEALGHWGAWDHKTYTVEDLAVGFLTFADGATLTIESSFAAHIENDVFNIQIMGTKGGATFSPLAVFTNQDGYMVNQTPAFIGNQDGFDYKMKHWLECMIDGVKSDAPGEDGLMVQQMLDGVYDSAKAGHEIAIKPLFSAGAAKAKAKAAGKKR